MIKKTFILLTAAILLFGCSSEENKPVLKPAYELESLLSHPFTGAEQILTEKLPDSDLEKISENKIIRPDDTVSLAPNEMETLRQYLCIGLASTSYANKKEEFTVDLYQFTESQYAYGYYSRFRPDGVKTLKIGAESFINGNSLYLTQADYLIIISQEDLKPNAVQSVATKISANIAGGKSTPPFFILFPYGKKLYPTDKFYPYEHLGIKGFNEVYTSDHLVNDDTVTLFLTLDTSGEKYFYLTEYVKEHDLKSAPVKRFNYDQGYSIAFEVEGHGVLIAGLVKGKLAGAIGYKPKKHEVYVKRWLDGFQ